MCTPDLRLLRFSGVVFAEPPFKSAATQARGRLARCHRRIDAGGDEHPASLGIHQDRRWDLKADFDRHHLTEVIDSSRMFDHLHNVLSTFEKLQATPTP
jgi:hypothetical protein